MRIGHLQPSRPEWFDRNPTAKALSANVTIAGSDAGTVRATYTAPTGKKAYLDIAMMTCFRTVDGTPNQQFVVGLLYSDGAASFYIQLIKSSVSNYGAVGDQWLGQGGILTAGQTLQFVTSSSFTDGTVEVLAGAKVTEFDA